VSWERWRPEIAKACDGSHHTIEGIERELAEGRAHLLTQPDCCFIVEVVAYPTETACQVMWAAGSLPALTQNLVLVERWAKANGCSEMLIEGHPGWARALKDLNYRRWSVTVRKALVDGH
jgi:hypothetical protein